jgi:hypothetical protein
MTTIRKIHNKERCAFRGSKLRYAVWRAQYNLHWERLNKAMAEQLCIDHGLNIEDHISSEKRNKWDHTYHDLRDKGYYHKTKSIRDHMIETPSIESIGEMYVDLTVRGLDAQEKTHKGSTD